MRTEGFYDPMAEHYHLLFDDWDAAMGRQGTALDAVLREELGSGPRRVLDCSCGIGTQAMGLARFGHRVTGSDLSTAAVERARREAERRGLVIDFRVADLRDLRGVEESGFDAVGSFDNALPHLERGELKQAVRAMRAKVRDHGLMMASIRDYDRLIVEKPPVQGPSFFGAKGERRIVHQVWDWIASDRYEVHVYITLQEQGTWRVRHFMGEYRAMLRNEVTSALEEAGFADVRWRMPQESGVYIPLVTARAE